MLDFRASGRVETDAYQQGLLVGENVTPIHLGGMRRRGGTRKLFKLPNVLTLIQPTAVTVPQGGTAANVHDHLTTTVMTTTNNVSNTNPYVVVRYDMGAAYTIDFIDAVGILSGGGTSTQFCIQYSTDDAAWTTWGTSFALVDIQVRSYRRVGPITARYFRIAKIGGTNMGSVHITLNEFSLWSQTAVISEVRNIDFEISTEDRYCVVLTDRTATVFQDGVFVSSVAMPYVSADLKDIDAATDAENMVLTHQNYPPRFLLREGTNNFQSLDIVFDHVPTSDFGDSLSPVAISDIQDISFGAFVQGDTFQVELHNARSAAIVFGGDVIGDGQSATANNIAKAVQGLYTVKGFIGVTCVRTGAFTYRVTFAGGSADNYQQMSIVPLVTQGSVTGSCVKVQNGTSREEAVWSAVRGYPITVVFFEGRMYFGGTKSLQESLFGSEVHNILNFDPDQGLSDEAIFTTISGQQLNAIQGLFAGRSLQLFTTGGEFRFIKPPGVPIVPGDAPVNQTQYGSARIRPVTIDGATIFIQRTRKAVRDFRYDINQDAFDSLGVSALAPALINGVTDLAAWNGSTVDELGLVFVVNNDGTIACFNSRKEAGVQAWTRWKSQGFFKSIGVVLQDIYVSARRTINGVDSLFFEQVDDTCYTDCCVKVHNVVPTAVITGLDHLNGIECRVKADGFVLESVTPVAGSVTLERASTDVEIGLNFNPTMTPMPLASYTPGRGPNFMSKRRIVEARVRVHNTLGLRVNGSYIEDNQFDVVNFDTPAMPFSGIRYLEESTNWDKDVDKLVTFDQIDPLPFEILAYEVVLESNP